MNLTAHYKGESLDPKKAAKITFNLHRDSFSMKKHIALTLDVSKPDFTLDLTWLELEELNISKEFRAEATKHFKKFFLRFCSPSLIPAVEDRVFHPEHFPIPS